MAARRSRRRFRRKRRSYRKRRSNATWGPQMNVRIRKFAVQAVGAGKGAGFAYSFCLEQFLPAGIYWDYYRINTIVVRVIPRCCPSFPGSPGARGVCFGSIDLDDVGTPLQPSDIEELQNVKTWFSDHVKVFKWRPRAHTMVATLEPTSKPAGIGPARMWLNAANSDVRHYGIKLWLTNNGVDDIYWDIEAIAYVSFRQPLIKSKFKVEKEEGGPTGESASRLRPSGGVAFGDEPPALPPLGSASLPY